MSRAVRCPTCSKRVSVDGERRIVRHRSSLTDRLCSASGTREIRAHSLHIETTGECPSGKARFADQYVALIALSQDRASRSIGNTARQEQRIYECTIPACGKGWHFTSQPYRQTVTSSRASAL